MYELTEKAGPGLRLLLPAFEDCVKDSSAEDNEKEQPER